MLNFLRYKQPWRRWIVRSIRRLPPCSVRSSVIRWLYPKGIQITFHGNDRRIDV